MPGVRSKRPRLKEVTNKNGKRRSYLTVLFQNPQVLMEKTSVWPAPSIDILITVTTLTLILNIWWFHITMTPSSNKLLFRTHNTLWPIKSGIMTTLSSKLIHLLLAMIQEPLWWSRTFPTNTPFKTYPMKLIRISWTVMTSFIYHAI